VTARRKKKTKARRRRRNPQVLAISNPSAAAVRAGAEVAKALARYREFHGEDPPEIVRMGTRRRGQKPRVLIVLGRVVDIVYEPTTGQRKRVHWIHDFGPDARLCTDPTGRELVILTGDNEPQVDFSRGIVS